MILNIYKPEGLTPLQALDRLRQIKPELREEKLSYLGRLDPMAEGVMIVAVGEENKKREDYLNLDKTYEFKVLFGLTTDTYDILGLPQSGGYLPPDWQQKFKTEINNLVGRHSQTYPPYSSKTVEGKPLFQWTRENQLHTIAVPRREIEIYSAEILSIEKIESASLLKDITGRIDKIQGDFRQNQTVSAWQNLLQTGSDYPTASVRINCSSGTYIRSICNLLGQKLRSGALALKIKRTRMGEFTDKESVII